MHPFCLSDVLCEKINVLNNIIRMSYNESMENLVLYRKYRPKSFSQVIGQEHIVRTLTNALVLDKTAHAYLFCGPRGTGKTTVARLLAKAVNCENRQEGFEPCNKCAACEEINEGRALDLIEIDAASNRGIDEIRELREGIKFAPTRLKYKVFIIDEVHMLTREAFNALLKTLEEPPGHAIFILATTELHKVPQTIISRCQHFDFHKISLNKLVARLKFIADHEGVKIEKSALELIALNGDGVARDAESLLGQVMAMEDKEITLAEAQTILGATDISSVIAMIGLLAQKNLKDSLEFINKLVEDGFDLSQFIKSLINYARKMMILAVSVGAPTAPGANQEKMRELIAPELTDEQFNVILEQGRKFSGADFIKLLRLLIRAENETKSAILPQLPLELAAVEWIGSK